MRQQTCALSAWNVILLAACLLLAACGGSSGGGSPAPPPPAANRPPVITSPASVTVNEQTTGPVYTLTATDPDGDPITLSVVSGGDAAVFSFAPATGILSLSQGLYFGAPQDADGNNIYLVTFEARDGRGGVASLTVEIRVLEVAVGMALRRVGTGFTQPLFLAGIPGTDRVVVLQKGGLARVLNPETGTIEGVPFLDVTGDVSTDSERGLLGLVFSPDFASDRVFYVNLTNTSWNTEIRRYRVNAANALLADPVTEETLITIDRPRSNHNAG